MNQEMVRTNRDKRLLPAYMAPVLIGLTAFALSLAVYPLGAIIMRDAVKGWHYPAADIILSALNYGVVFFSLCVGIRAFRKGNWLYQSGQRLLGQLAVAVLVPLLSSSLVYLPYFCFVHNLPWPPPSFVFFTSIAVLFSLVFTAVVSAFFFLKDWRASNLKSVVMEKENLKSNFEVLKSQLSPHFLFHNLNILRILATRQSAKTVDYIDHFSEVFRHIVESDFDRPVPLSKELDFIRSYMYLLEVRFSHALVYTIDVPHACGQCDVLSNSLQLLIENALKHNRLSVSSPLHIMIFCEEEHLVVQNSLNRKARAASTGIGLRNISSRYRMIARKDIRIEETPQYFIVSLPLLIKNDYENIGR